MEQAGTFYINALKSDEIKTALATFGIDEATLTAAQAKVKNVEVLLAAQLKEKEEAQDATKARDGA